jgi:hypothetical protein
MSSSPNSDSSPYVFVDEIVQDLEKNYKIMLKQLTDLEQKMEGHEKKLTNLEQIMEGHEKRLTGLEENPSEYSPSGLRKMDENYPTNMYKYFSNLNTGKLRGGKLTRKKLLKKSKRKTKKH